MPKSEKPDEAALIDNPECPQCHRIMLRGTRLCLACGECMNRAGLSIGDVAWMEPVLRQFDNRFKPATPTKYTGNWPKSMQAQEDNYERNAIKCVREMKDKSGTLLGYKDPVDRLLKDPWYAQNLSMRPCNIVGAPTCAKWLLQAWMLKNAATGGNAFSTEVVLWVDPSTYSNNGLAALFTIIVIVATLSCVVGCSFKCMLRAC